MSSSVLFVLSFKSSKPVSDLMFTLYMDMDMVVYGVKT